MTYNNERKSSHVKKVKVNLCSAYYNQPIPFLKCFTI